MTGPDGLLETLRRYWGYDSFRPMQERIVTALLQGRDAAVVMPTGGGKSLCYQLPALMLGRTAVVISPLIALMQDQVAQLAEMGISAAVLNSALEPAEQHRVMREARSGAYRLLYLSPERLARGDTLGWLRQLPLSLFAIDEAHCISEWGHEFRPEYRQLKALRANFPETPIAAFTASATQRVRHDILEQLGLRDPAKFIASFRRPNLRYLVRECDKQTQPRMLVAALRAVEDGHAIVYAPTIERVESTVDFLAERGIRAVPYHGQMNAATRRANQEQWMSDTVRVLVGTIAFGLGINKATVRAVIHLSLPKSIEQYYQEAGRAGRDGEPADCVLLWRKQDHFLLKHFIEQIVDRGEYTRARERYRTMCRFVESAVCRQRQICVHFGETPKWERCELCDTCAGFPEWVEKRVTASARPAATAKPAAPTADSEMIEYFKEWRRTIAAAKKVPAYVVMHDATLVDLCRKKPRTLRELMGVSGIGSSKAQLYGESIIAALAEFQAGARAERRTTQVSSPVEETLAMLAEGRTLASIAQARGRRLETIVNTVALLVEQGHVSFREDWIPAERLRQISEAIGRLGGDRFKPLRDALPAEIPAEEIRLVLAGRKRAGA